MSWHSDRDDDVDNDSVGWFNARDYDAPQEPAGDPAGTRGKDDRNDPFAWMRSNDYQGRTP